MPTVRYQIRGEYGLADPELYREADKEDPEALLEGVAMAGLVGVLRQLGDLAQFAAEIFHDLHEEVMATASRGHGLMLRVQQLEAEFPSIERAFLAQTNPSRFAYNAGIDWHANLQVDQNLVTRGDMPRFILDSYEDCRGPPRLFMLDKFDVAGAGACLKRYSDPSSFKVELAASGKMEPEVQRDNKARKVKKRGSRWRNGEAAESFLAPRIDSNLQTITSAKVPTRRVKLKNRNLTDSDITSRRSYLEHLIEANTPEQTVLLENSISNSNTIIQSTNSSESAPQVREIMIDNASDSPKVKEGTPVQSPTKQEEALSPLNESGYQKLNVEEISERVPELSDDVQKSYRTSYIVEQKVVLANLDKKTEACLDDYRSSEAEENLLDSKEVDQKKSFPDTNLITEGGNDDYRSEDIGSELDNYMDALNTMELEIETDTVSRAKSDPGFSNMEYQQIVSGINENQQDLTASSELNSVDNFTAPLGLNGVLKNGISSPPNSNSSGSLRDAQPPQGNMSNSEMPSNPEIGLWEIHDKPSQRNGEAVQLVSLAHLHTSETYDTKESDIASLKSETGVTSYSYSPVDVHSQGTNELRSVSIQPNDSPRHIHSQGSDKVQTVSIQPNELYSTYVEGTHEVAELSDGKILQMENMCIEKIFELPSGTHDTMEEQSSLYSNSDFSDGLLNLSDVEGSGSEYAKDQIPDDRGETFEIPDHLSEPKEEFFLEEAPKLYVEGSLPTLTVDIKGDGKESTEQETKDSSGGSTSLKTSAFSPKVISTVMQPKDVVVDIDAVEQREDLAKDISDYVIDTHEVAEPLDSELPCHVEITELLSQANDDKAFPRRPEDSCISSDSPLIALDTPENLHSKEDDAKQITENMADTLGDRVLEGVATEHVEETPTSFTVEVGDAEESMGQYKVEDTSSANSGVLVEASPIVMQSDGILIEMENSVAPSEGIAYSELVAGNANETEEGKILMRNEVTHELEHFSDVVIQEPWSVEFVEPLPMPSGDEIIPDDKQLHSEEPAWVVIDRSEAVGENMELPSEFTVSSLHEDSAPCEKLPYDDNSLTENVTIKADVSNHDPCPVYSSEVSGFVQELLEDCVPDDAVLGQHKREISEVSSPKDTTSLYSESNLCMAVLPQIEDQPISSPVSSSELTDSSDSKLPPGISQMFSAEHSQRDFCPNVYEENPISSPESEDPGFAEGMSPPSICLLREPAVPLVEASVLKIGNQQNEACSHQKVDLESNGLQSEIAYTDEGNNIQSKSEDLHDKPSDQGPEPDNGCMNDSCTPPSTCQLVESSTSVEEASKSEAADEPSTVSSNQEGDLPQVSNLQSGRTYFDEQKSIQSNADSYDDKPLEPGAEPDCGNVIESDTPPSSTHNPEELKPEPLVPPGCISDLSVDSLASCISTSVLSPNASSDLAIAKTSPQDPSQQQLGESISSFQIQDVDETPPPPPLPPLQWRTGKLWLGASTSGGNAVQPPSGTNPFMSPASIDEKHSQESVPDGREVLPADIFAPLSVWEDERFQHGSFASEGTIDQPRSLSNLPPIVEGERYQHGTLFVEADMTHSSDPLLGVSNSPPIEDEKHSCCGDAPAPPLQILTSTHSHLPEEDQVQAVQGRRPQLGLLVQSLELQRSQHEASVVERAPVLPLNPFLVTSPMEDWQHQYGYGVYGGESVQRLNLSAPLPIAGATIPQYGFMYPTGENPSTFYDIIVPTVEGERPKWKHRSIRDRPRDPLIEAVAAHDKSTLRKVSELDKPPAKSKFEERDTLLEQIRKKSFSLKPAGVTKPNIKGPSTNLKVSAILEKANAIRQAFAGSDEDDDGDSWSDS